MTKPHYLGCQCQECLDWLLARDPYARAAVRSRATGHIINLHGPEWLVDALRRSGQGWLWVAAKAERDHHQRRAEHHTRATLRAVRTGEPRKALGHAFRMLRHSWRAAKAERELRRQEPGER